MCLCSVMSAEYDDLPDAVKREVQAFAAVAVARLLARSRADLALFDALIESDREAGLLPG